MISWSTFFAGFVAGIATLVGLFLQSIPLEIGPPSNSIDRFQYNAPVPLPIWKVAMSVLPRFQHAPKILMPPALACMEDLSASVMSGVLCNLAELNVAPVISRRSNKEGMHLEELAEKIGVKRIDILRRLIQLASLKGYFYMDPNQVIFNTPMSTYLQTNNDTNADFLCFQRHLIFQIDGNPVGSDFSYGQNIEAGASNLIAFMKREQDEVSPTSLSMQGKEFWDVLDHYGKRAAFDNFMTFMTNSLPTHFDFPFGTNCDTVVDLGGGHGHTLYKIMETYPKIKNAVLFDLESQVFHAENYWRSLANEKLMKKVDFVTGNFFDASSFPPRKEGKTCYVLRQILHDWNDASALKILTNVASQMQESDLLLVEELLPNDNLDLTDIPRMTFDFVMMVQYDGEERSVASMKKLLGKAGLDVKSIHDTRSPFRWAEVVKARSLVKNY